MPTIPAINLDLSVIVANKNHSNTFEAFVHALGLSVEKIDEVSFNDVYVWKKEFVYAFFTEKGTLLCVPSKEYNIAAASKESQVAFLDISKNASAFNLEYAVDGSMERMYTNIDGTVRRNIKAPLQWEAPRLTYSEILSNGINALTGQGLSIYQQQQAIRYRIIK